MERCDAYGIENFERNNGNERISSFRANVCVRHVHLNIADVLR